MQYLSKAYNYYSGINPATLSGAIDVIVVRHVDANGNITLASSPFHVRFGKLQVLRAAEKRVTMKMPNNLPSPHIAPFSMKVGDTGEAFFVLETSEDVPEEMLTSPVVMPIEEPTDDEIKIMPKREEGLVTKEPFGGTEQRVQHPDVEYLDLDARPAHPPSNPPNPLEAKPGESTRLPRNDKLSPGDELPKIKPGEGEGPEVVYGSDVVLDMSGYHGKASNLDALAKDLSDLRITNETPANKDDPYAFELQGEGGQHTFELSLCGKETDAFDESRVSYSRFMDDHRIAHDPRLIMRYGSSYLTADSDEVKALASWRDNQAESSKAGDERRGSQRMSDRKSEIEGKPGKEVNTAPQGHGGPTLSTGQQKGQDASSRFAKTLRLSSDQLKQLELKSGPNTVQFSVTSSYSGMATCSARIFLWDDTDQIVISDIDGTITKSDALGHVFAAIGRDWTHMGIAKLYTDICNNGYKMLYLTSRAIGQADTTREYLKSITQGDYRLPEGPVIMSPDRLMASLHREVIMRKPELFKMACLRDIQRLFGPKAIDAFYAGFGNRITDAMSYRSVGVPTSKIYTIDSTGVVKTELLQTAGHKGSYVALNNLVNEVFPPVKTKFKPEFTDFNYWRADIPSVNLPDLSPPSPALSARSDSSVWGKIMRRGSKQVPVSASASELPSSRPSSPLVGPITDEISEIDDRSVSSMPGSFESQKNYFPNKEDTDEVEQHDVGEDSAEQREYGGDEAFDDDTIFDDDILAAGEMKNVPF